MPRELPEGAVQPAAKVIARALCHRADQIASGSMGDRQTQTPNQIAEEALADSLPAIEAAEEETGRKPPGRTRGGCTDPWHDQATPKPQPKQGESK